MSNPIAALALGDVVKPWDNAAIAEESSGSVAVPIGSSIARKVFWQLSFDVAPTAMTFDLEGSLDNDHWVSLVTTTATAGVVGVVPSLAFLRGTISGLAAGSATTMTLALTLSSGFDVYRDLLPGTDATYNLGNANFRFKMLNGGVAQVGATPVDSVAATATLTYSANAVTAGKKVVFGGITYTFRAAVAVDYDIKIEAAVDDTAQNLTDAINLDDPPGTGNNDVGGKYMAPAANPFASAVLTAGSNLITLTALVNGTAGNVAFPTTDEAEIMVSTFENEDTGIDQVPSAVDGQLFRKSDNSLLYVSIGDAPSGTWKKATLSAI